MVKLILLDFDDTLVLTEEACFILENRVLKQLNRQQMPRQIHQLTWGQPLLEAIRVRSPGVNVEEFRKLLEIEHQAMVVAHEIDVVPAKNYLVLDELKQRGVKFAVLTSRKEYELQHIINYPDHKLHEYVDKFYHRDNLKHHKPDPKAFDEIEHDFGLSPEECTYIGDSVSDAESATKAGLKCVISLESGIRKKEDFSDFPGITFISDFSELSSVL